MKKLLLLLGLLLLLPIVSAQNVSVGVYVLNLGKFDVATGAFTADFYLSMTCDDCSTVDYEFMNGRATVTDKIIDTTEEKFYRVQANLVSPVDLKRFPFDKQDMQIIIEDKSGTIDDIRYIPNLNQTGVDESIAFTGWNLGEWTAEERQHEYAIYGENYSQYVFSMPISRIQMNSIFKTFLPIFFIVLVMLSSFVLDPDKITTRLGMVGSALVASVMFHISISNQIPPVGYLTFADKFMLATYLIVLISFIVNVWMLEMLERKKHDLVEKWHRRTEFTMFITVAVIYAALFFFL